MDKEKQTNCDKAMQEYPGMAIDNADDEKVTRKTVDERTKAQNNNPRSNDDAMPTNPGK